MARFEWDEQKNKSNKEKHGISFEDARKVIKALDAFQFGKAGIEVPDEAIEYDDADIAYDPEFDDYEWKRTDIDPLGKPEGEADRRH